MHAVGASDPQALFTLTLAGDEFAENQRRMKNLRRRLRRSGYEVEWAWKVECSSWDPSRHHHHVQGYLRGDVEEWVLNEHALAVGFGPVSQLLLLKQSPEKAPRYLWGREKRHECYAMNLPHALWINGGQMVRTSSRFWRFRGEPVSGGMDALTRQLA